MTYYMGEYTSCSAHFHTQYHGDEFASQNDGPRIIDMSKFVDHSHLIADVTFAHADLESLPVEFFDRLPLLHTLELSQNKLKSLPPGIGKCTNLNHVNLSGNELASLPQDFGDAMQCVRILKISNNPLGRLHPALLASPVLEQLYAEAIGIDEIPDSVAENSVLTLLHLGDNALQRLPPSFVRLTRLVDLDLSGVKWIDTFLFLSHDMFTSFMKRNPLLAKQVSAYGRHSV